MKRFSNLTLWTCALFMSGPRVVDTYVGGSVVCAGGRSTTPPMRTPRPHSTKAPIRSSGHFSWPLMLGDVDRALLVVLSRDSNPTASRNSSTSRFRSPLSCLSDRCSIRSATPSAMALSLCLSRLILTRMGVVEQGNHEKGDDRRRGFDLQLIRRI